MSDGAQAQPRWADRLASTVRTLAGVLLVIVTVTMLAVIAGRYVGFVTAWADEVARIAFVWSACLGAASGTHRGLNFAIPLIATRASGRIRRIVEIGVALTILSLCVLLAWAITKSLPVAALARLPALGVTGAWFHAAVAAFASLTALFTLFKLAELRRAPV